MLKQIKTTDSTKILQIISDHMAVSVSIFSNVPDYDDKPILLCNYKPDILINEFMQTSLQISLKLNLYIKLNIMVLLQYLMHM